MRTPRLILTTCLIGTLLCASAMAQKGDRDWGERPMSSQRGAQRGGQRKAGGGRMSPELMQQTIIAKFVGNADVAEKLGLSEEQRTRITDVIQSSRAKQIRLAAEQEIAAMEQVRLLAAKEIDEEAVMAAVQKTGALSTELAKCRIRPIVQIKKILTPDQIAQAQSMIRHHVRERFGGERIGNRGGREGFKRGPERRGGPRGDEPAPEEGMPPPPRPEEGGIE